MRAAVVDGDDDADGGNKNRVDQGGFMGLSRILSNAAGGSECNFADAASPRQRHGGNNFGYVKLHAIVFSYYLRNGPRPIINAYHL